MSLVRIVLLLSALALAPPPFGAASAQSTAPALYECQTLVSKAKALEACNAIIASGDAPSRHKSQAYAFRSLLQVLDGNFLRARDELSSAMAFSGPGSEETSVLQFLRGLLTYFDARDNNGSFATAVLDYDDVIAAITAKLGDNDKDGMIARSIVLTARGLAKAGQRDYAAAVADQEAALALAQSAEIPLARQLLTAFARFGLGDSYFRMGDLSQASDQLAASLELFAANPWAHESLAEASAAQGRKQEAAHHAALAMSVWHWLAQVPKAFPGELGVLQDIRPLALWRGRAERRFAEIVEGKLSAEAARDQDATDTSKFSGPSSVVGRKVALVIGNSEYSLQTPLRNPVNDAKKVSAALNRLGFEVIEGFNLGRSALSDRLHDFARRVPGADVGLVYYAGHAIQYNGANFLAPVDAQIRDETDVDHELQSVDTVMRDLSRASRVRVLILDACRDNPLQQRLAAALPRSRSTATSRGLARLANPGDGFIVVYATQSGDVAEDGAGENSPFARAFLDNVETRGLEIVQLFKRVAQSVKTSTANRQSPELSLSFTEELYLAGN